MTTARAVRVPRLIGLPFLILASACQSPDMVSPSASAHPSGVSITADGAGMSITANAAAVIKSYPSRPPLMSGYMPDYTSASSQFNGNAERHGVNVVDLVTARRDYQTAHPADAVCGDPRSDCGEGANNGGVPEYHWTWQFDAEIDLLTHASRAPSLLTLLIFQSPGWMQSQPGNPDSFPADIAAYGRIAADIWHHLFVRAPAWVSRTHIEVWNEPDGKGISLSQYRQLYAVVARDIHRVAAVFNSTAVVGGPTLATLSLGNSGTEGNWLRPFLSDPGCNPYIDFVSWHEYADQHLSASDPGSTRWADLVSQYPAMLGDDVAGVRHDVTEYDSALTVNGGSHLGPIPLEVTEYNDTEQNGRTTNTRPAQEIPYIAMVKQAAFNSGLDVLDFFTNGGGWDGQVDNGFYLYDRSNVIAPWAWDEYLFNWSLGMEAHAFSVVASSSSDPRLFPAAFRFTDGSLGLVVVNPTPVDAAAVTLMINHSGLTGGYTIHAYFVDPAHPVQAEPDLTGSALGGSITFTARLPASSVSAFTLGSGGGTPVHVPRYQFHSMSDDFTGYGGAGSAVAQPSNGHYSDEFPAWVSAGHSVDATHPTGMVATTASDALRFADGAAGPGGTALKVSGNGDAYVRSGSYRVDWTVPPSRQVTLTFQADWSNEGGMTSQLVLDPNQGSPAGNPLGSRFFLRLKDTAGIMTLDTSAGKLGASYRYAPVARRLDSWRLRIDRATVEVDHYMGGAWQVAIGPVAHNLPQTATGMEAGLIYMGLATNGGPTRADYWANVSVS